MRELEPAQAEPGVPQAPQIRAVLLAEALAGRYAASPLAAPLAVRLAQVLGPHDQGFIAQMTMALAG